MRLRSIRLCFSAFLLATCFANELRAQTTTSGGLTGVVTDQSGALVLNADVEIKDNSKGTTQSTKTDREGVYRFFFVAPARYTLTVTHQSFRPESRTVNVLLGPPVTVNVSLQIAQTNSEITVSSEAPLVQAENGDVSVTMSQKQISELPNPGNDLTYIAQTAPGVIMNTETGGPQNFSSLGMPGTSNVFTLDGMSENDNSLQASLVGSLNLLLGQNQIQEATVVSIGYSGQFGGAAGAMVNYITKSGGNRFHGNAQYFWNGTALNANDWFYIANGVRRPFDDANQWAGSLSGPIKRDKLFFYFDSEGARLTLSLNSQGGPLNSIVLIPSPQFESATIAHIDSKFGSNSASDAFYKKIFALYNAAPGAGSAMNGSLNGDGCLGFADPDDQNGFGHNGVPCAMHFFATHSAPFRDTLTMGRVDWNASAMDRVFVRLQNEIGHSTDFVDPISSLFNAYGQHLWWQGQLNETHTFGSWAASQFLLAGFYLRPITQVQNPSQTLAAMPTNLNFSDVTGVFTNLGGANDLAHPSGLPGTQFQFSEDLAKTWRSHKFAVGASFERIDWTNIAFLPNLIGTLSPQSLDAFYQGGFDPASKNTDFTLLTQEFAARTRARIAFYTLGLYGQDDWHARPNLSLMFALRAEHRSNPTCRDGCFARLAGPFGSLDHEPSQPYNQAILTNQSQAFTATDNLLWSPRFSFAWQPRGVSGNWVLRGGVGIFYDPVSGAHAMTLFTNPPLINSYSVQGDNLAPGEITSLFHDAQASNTTFLEDFQSGAPPTQIQSIPGFAPPAITNPQTHMRTPEFQRWTLDLQRTLRAHTSASVSYFGNHGIHELAQNPNANAFGFGSFPATQCSSPTPSPPCADPRFGEINDLDTNAVSNSNGMVASLRHHFVGGLFQVNYTYSHTLDEVSNGGLNLFTFSSSIYPQDATNLRGSYGAADYDVRHSLNANYVWELPLKTALRGHGPDNLLKGWQVSGTVFARTGFPYTVIDFAESGLLSGNNFFGTVYAVPVGPLGPSTPCGEGAAFPPAREPCQPPQFFTQPDGSQVPNPNARFLQSQCETGFNQGNLGSFPACLNSPAGSVALAQGRNHFRAPGYFDTDFTIMKITRLERWQNATLGIGLQFFNFFNHPNFSIPDNGIMDPTFGQILSPDAPPTSIVGSGIGGDASPRMIQLKAQIQF